MKNSTNNTLDQREADHAINNYTRVPNMLVDGYPELHPQDKWLFVCLVRLCGKEGTRYLSLRYIADRTGFSRGPLGGSKDKPGMIQRLHNAGLIHAEIKRRKSSEGNEKNNAQYHITIADTWKLNYDFFHPEACPDSGRDISEPVLKQDKTRPKTGQDRPKTVLKQDATCPDSEPTVRLQNKITESNKITERKKESPTVIQEPPTSSQPDALSPSLSQNSLSEETKPLEVDYPLFDRLCREKGYAADFKVPRNEKNNAAIQELRSQGATPEQVEFVFSDIWDDKDTFWIQHRGKPSTVASQFTARVWKMSQVAQKRHTTSGLPSYTEDKTLGQYKPFNLTPVPQPTEQPKEPALPTGYTRLKMEKPARARSLQARLQAQKQMQ
jgi:hypothetical protein